MYNLLHLQRQYETSIKKQKAFLLLYQLKTTQILIFVKLCKLQHIQYAPYYSLHSTHNFLFSDCIHNMLHLEYIYTGSRYEFYFPKLSQYHAEIYILKCKRQNQVYIHIIGLGIYLYLYPYVYPTYMTIYMQLCMHNTKRKTVIYKMSAINKFL